MTDRSPPKSDMTKTSDTDFTETPLKNKIGDNLKKLYDDVVNEDVPDDFLALLMQADKQDK